MQVSPGRLTGIKVVLWVGLVLGALWGIGSLVFPETVHDATAPEGEPFTNTVNVLSMLLGAMSIAWAVATAIALGNPLANRGLLQAIIGFTIIFGLVGLYATTVVAEQATAPAMGSQILIVALGVALWVLYPWGRKAS